MYYSQRVKLRTILDQIKIWENLIQAQDEGFLTQGKSEDDTPTAKVEQRWLRPPLPPPGIPKISKRTEPGHSTTVVVEWKHHHLYVTEEPPAAMVASKVQRKRSEPGPYAKPSIRKQTSRVNRVDSSLLKEIPSSKMGVDIGAIHKFLIYYQEIYPENSSKYTVMDHWKLGAVADAECRFSAIHSLLPSAKYQFAVCARNSYGKGHIGAASDIVELPKIELPSSALSDKFADTPEDNLGDEDLDPWRLRVTHGKHLVWTMAIMSETKERLIKREVRIRTSHGGRLRKKSSTVGKFVISVAKEKYVEVGKGGRVTLHPQLQKRRLEVSKLNNFCCKLNQFDYKPLPIAQTFRIERLYYPIEESQEPETETDSGTDTDLEDTFHEMEMEMKTERDMGESETAEADAMPQSKVDQKLQKKRPWYQLDVYLHTERKWNVQTSAAKLEAVAATRHDELLFRCSGNECLGVHDVLFSYTMKLLLLLLEHK